MLEGDVVVTLWGGDACYREAWRSGNLPGWNVLYLVCTASDKETLPVWLRVQLANTTLPFLKSRVCNVGTNANCVSGSMDSGETLV